MAKKILYLIVEGISNGSDVMVGVEGLSTTKRDILKKLNARYRDTKAYYENPETNKYSDSFDVYESDDIEQRTVANVAKIEVDYNNIHGNTHIYVVAGASSDGQGNFYSWLAKACTTMKEAKEAIQSLYEDNKDYYNPPEDEVEGDDDIDFIDLYDEDDVEHHMVTEIINVEIPLDNKEVQLNLRVC